MVMKRKRSVAQLAEQRSPKPQVGGSSPSWPASILHGVRKPYVFLKEKVRGMYLFIQEVKVEVLKVSWPDRKEVVQITLVVGIMILVSSFFLWGMDSIILKGIKLLLAQKA